MKKVVLASLIIAGLWQVPLAAQVYKWVDEKGNVHYSDRPQSLDSEQLNLNVTPEPVEADSTQQQPADPQTAANAAQTATVATNGTDTAMTTANDPAAQSAPAENLSVPPPKANCNAAAENARRLLLSQNEQPELRRVAAGGNFKSSFIQSCRQAAENPQGQAEAVCIQRAKSFAEYQECGN